MAKKPSSDYDPFKAENPMMALSALGLHTATYFTDIWLGAMRGMVDSTKELERRADEALKTPVSDAPSETNKKPVARKTTSKRTTAKKPTSNKTVASKPTAKKPTRASAAKTTAAAKDVAQGSDDLKLITGIGPKLEQFLKRRGLTSFEQIAGLKKRDINKLNDELSLSGRIERDDWVGQAKELIGK